MQEEEKANKNLAVYSNYVDLMAYTFNEKLNEGNSNPNIIKLISSVRLRISASSLRILCSTTSPKETSHKKTEPDRHEMPEDEPQPSNFTGLQFVIDSLFYKSTFYKKKVNMRVKRLDNLKKGKGLKKWASEKGFSIVNMIYAGFFKGNDLLPLKPEEFIEVRKKNWPSSMENPVNFRKFFGLDPKGDRAMNLANFSDDYINHLFNFEEKRLISSSKFFLYRPCCETCSKGNSYQPST